DPPMTYLERWRITRAANLLLDTNDPLGWIAEAVGYASDSVFGKAFKRVTGQAPGRYRCSRNP
ncbi:MAG: helix-turn-helix transcriptional regulator, partial [Burkholderiaceae bacterium]